VIPALAIARELKARYSAEILLVGTARGIENRLAPQAGFPLALIKVGALKNVSVTTRLRTLISLPMAIVHARKIIREFGPQVVVGVGGYASGPAMAAAILGHIPTLAFESNYVPGFANRVVGRRVSAGAVHFKETARYFRNARVVGVPVRPEFCSIAPRPANARPTLLVFGGSQGAHAINQAMTSAIAEVQRSVPGLHVVHQTGDRDYNEVQAAYTRAGTSVEVSAFIDNMPQAFAQADLLVCRAGASTVAEIAAAGTPAIFIPFPRAADDHQRRNAEAVAASGAAIVIPETELSPQSLARAITELLTDREKLKQMSQKARALSHPDATREVAQMIAELARA
jgi:UDP-N-acetylglucosamine--N-acetylmuramyl-(pentapeptide) pyrophosphoryl-undecaprenol N-acetylglucosamine transferase